MTTHPFGNMRSDHEGTRAAADDLELAAALLELRGQHRAAKSVKNVVGFLDGYGGPEVVHAGLTALVLWARREATDATLVRDGDRVRITRPENVNVAGRTYTGSRTFTGVWHRDATTNRPMVQCDETGEERGVDADRDTVEVLYLGSARDVRTALPTAVTVVRSAWLPPVYELDDEPIELTDEETAELQRYFKQREREHTCPCGDVATHRAVAWTVVESVHPDEIAQAITWEAPSELGAETVCSTTCGQEWARKFQAEAVLPLATQVRFRTEPYVYHAEFGEVGPRLAQARAAAIRAANILDEACTAWVGGETVKSAQLIGAARPDVAQLLDAVLTMTSDPNDAQPPA